MSDSWPAKGSRRLVHTLRIYGKLELLHLRVHLEYEADFWIGLVGSTLQAATGFVFVWVLLSRVPQVAGWTLWEVAFLYALVITARGFREVLCDGVWALRRLVNGGEFDRILVRPISPVLQVITQMSAIFGFGGVLLGLWIIARASSELGLAWDAGRVAFVCLSIVSSVMIIGAIDLATNCIAFWEPASTSSFPFLVFSFSEFAKYPLTLYGRLVQVFLTWVLPFAFVSYYPGSVLLGKPVEPAWLGWLSPLAGPIAALAAGVVWQASLRRYQGTGS